MGVPDSIFGYGAAGSSWSPRVKATRKNEVLEFFVDVAVGTHMPAQPIAAESMGIFSVIFLVKLVRISVSRGNTSE